MINIIDIGISNIDSVSRALTYLGIENRISSKLDDINSADKLILPGVGNFRAASERLYSSGIADAIKCEVMDKGKPILGICLGMQLLAAHGDEGGGALGLGLVGARVERMGCEKSGFCLPHIGWNDVDHQGMKLFSGVEDHSCFYFVHSYAMVPETSERGCEFAFCDYGVNFVAAVKNNNVLGTQFHPEKSQKDGLTLLKNFSNGVF